MSIYLAQDGREREGINKDGVQATANAGSVHNMQNEGESVLSQNDLVWFRRPVRISSRNFVTSTHRRGFEVGCAERDRGIGDAEEIKALTRAGIV